MHDLLNRRRLDRLNLFLRLLEQDVRMSFSPLLLFDVQPLQVVLQAADVAGFVFYQTTTVLARSFLG